MQEVIRDVPNTNITGFGDGRSTSFIVRGIGALRDPLSPDDTSFVVYVDGVPQPLFAADVGYLDLEQVELLKGPQGTLFGRNTTAGALNVTTRKPTDEPEFSIRGEIGEDGYALTEAIASGPIIPNIVAGRIALRFSGVNGFAFNTITGNDLGEQDVITGRGTLRFTPSVRTAITLSFFTDHDQRTFPFFLLRDAPGFPIGALVDDSTSRRRINSGTLTIEHQAEEFAFKSITNLTHLKTSDIYIDDTEGFTFAKATGLPLSVFAQNNTFTDWAEDQQTLSQEFLFSSRPAEPIAWVTGASYFHSRFVADYLNENAFFPILGGKRLNELATDSFAGFGAVTVPIGLGFKVTTGARFTHEQKTYDLQYFGNGAPGTVDAFRDFGNLNFNFLTGRASLAYDVTPDSTAYVTVSRGFKSGGYPRLAVDVSLGQPTEPFSSSKTWTYEAGYKYRAPGNTAYLNTSVFYNDVKDEHLVAFDPVVFSFRPANLDVISYGLELAAGISLTETVTVTGGIGYTKAELVNIDPSQPVADAQNGNRPTGVPKLTASAAVEYRQSIGDLGIGLGGHAFGHIAWEFVGDRAADVANSFFLDSYHIVNTRFGIEPVKGFEIYVFGKNMLDVTPQLAGAFLPPNAEVVIPGRGRIVGIGTVARW